MYTKQMPPTNYPVSAPPGTELPLANTHGTDPFVLKIHIDPPGNGFLMYDQDYGLKAIFASFQVAGSTLLDLETVSRFREACKKQGKPNGGKKVYMWAKRTSDWEVSITLDKFPKQENISW